MNKRDRNHRFDRIRAIGCLCCRRKGWWNAPDVHHLNLDEHAGQLRLGDEQTVGLCPWHHQGKTLAPLTAAQCRQILGPSLAEQPVEFRQVFGSDEQMLARQNELIADHELAVVGRAA